MKKILLSVLGMIAIYSTSATQYMHINLPNGNVYDVKVEKTDYVSHINKDGKDFIKVTRTDSTYSLYPLEGAMVTFDKEISYLAEDATNWNIPKVSIEGCVYDTTKAHQMRENGAEQYEIDMELLSAQYSYNNCIEEKVYELNLHLTNKEKEIQYSANKYTKQLFAAISEDSSQVNKNIIFSPTSFQFALAMLANGADDEAYSEISAALGQKEIPLDSLNEMYSKRLSRLQYINPNIAQISLVNGVFADKKSHFGKNFMQNIDEFYKAAAVNVDFSEDSTYVMMDKWAEESTNGMIKEIGVDKNLDLILVLANALSFQSNWAKKFDTANTTPGKFVTSKGDEIEVDKMYCTYGPYTEGETYQLVNLKFGIENRNTYHMNVILPKEGFSPLSVLAEIDLENIQYKKSEYYDGIKAYLKLPKFNVSSKIPLKEILEKTELEKAMSAIYNNITLGAIISDVNQNAHLEIDEDGAKGAAVTNISMERIGEDFYEYVDMDVNRPFIITIQNEEDHEILFIGLINDPTAK